MDGQGDDWGTRPDYERYAVHMEALELTDEQTRELLDVVWSIMSAFADYGFGIEPTQLICGWLRQSRAESADARPPVIDSKGRKTIQNFNAVAPIGAKGEEKDS